MQFALVPEVPFGAGLRGRLIGAPSDFIPIGGQKSFTNANSAFSYGYNANGDFFIDFVVPVQLGVSGQVPASYASHPGLGPLGLRTLRHPVGHEGLQPRRPAVPHRDQRRLINWLEAGDDVNTTLRAVPAPRRPVLRSDRRHRHRHLHPLGPAHPSVRDLQQRQRERRHLLQPGGLREPAVLDGLPRRQPRAQPVLQQQHVRRSEHIDAFNADSPTRPWSSRPRWRRWATTVDQRHRPLHRPAGRRGRPTHGRTARTGVRSGQRLGDEPSADPRPNSVNTARGPPVSTASTPRSVRWPASPTRATPRSSSWAAQNSLGLVNRFVARSPDPAATYFE